MDNLKLDDKVKKIIIELTQKNVGFKLELSSLELETLYSAVILAEKHPKIKFSMQDTISPILGDIEDKVYTLMESKHRILELSPMELISLHGAIILVTWHKEVKLMTNTIIPTTRNTNFKRFLILFVLWEF